MTLLVGWPVVLEQRLAAALVDAPPSVIGSLTLRISCSCGAQEYMSERQWEVMRRARLGEVYRCTDCRWADLLA